MNSPDAKRSLLGPAPSAAVLLVGVVMVAGGAGEAYHGSGIIEIERGWSAFIAGTILLTGGLVTVAIGLVLRSLGEVRQVLLQLGSPAAGFETPGYAAGLSSTPTLQASQQAAAIEGPALQIEPHFAGAGIASDEALTQPLILEEAVPPQVIAPVPTAAARERSASPLVSVASNAGAATSDGAHDEEPSDLDREMARLHAPAAVAPAAAPPPAAIRRSPMPVVATETSPPRVRSALRTKEAQPPASGLDNVSGRQSLDAAAQPAAAAPAPAAPRPPEVPSVVAAPPAPQPLAPAPVAAASRQPAVIGRYQSDGTSYVMFDDGSIEAQTEAGIYRFTSMAELKAFIET